MRGYKLSAAISLFLIVIAQAAVTITPDNSHIRYTGVVEKVNGSSGLELYRLKKEYIDMANGGYWSKDNAGTQSSITIQFKTASPNVSCNFALNTNYEDRWARVVLYRNGEEVSNKQGGTGLSLSVSGSATDGESALWTCVLPAFKAQYFNSITLDDGYTLEAIETERKPAYIALGNSITHGVGQTANATPFTYSWQVAKALGYELYNFAVGGSKIHTQVLDNFAGLHPELITVLWGYNDVNSPWDLSKAMGIYDSLITTLVTTYPNTKIVAIEQTYTSTTTGAQVPENTIDRLRTEQRAILEELQKIHKNLFIVTGLDYTDASSIADAVHLNDAGAKSLADGLIAEIPTFTLDIKEPVSKDTTVFRSEFEKSGDTLFTIPAFKSVVSGASDLDNVSVTSGGDIVVTNEITDTRLSIDSIHISVIQTSGDTLNVLIVDGVDYLLQQHGGIVQSEYLALEKNGEWATHNNLWGKGTAEPGTDFRIEMAYTGSLPDSTLIVWDVPSKAADFGGSSVWNYSNLMWGNRYNERDDLSGFPFVIGSKDSLVLSFDYTTLHDEAGHKVALNMFTTETDTLAPFSENRGDFFMVFDQVGNWVPPYPDTLTADTTLMEAPYILLHDEGIKNEAPYHYRRAIIKDGNEVKKGTIDLMKLFDRFDEEGFMHKTLSVPNIQFGIEVTQGMGAVRFNKLSINDGGSTESVTSFHNKSEFLQLQISNKTLSIVSETVAIKKHSIVNVKGQKITAASTLENGSLSVDITPLASGFYFTTIEFVDGSSLQFQFVKK